MLKKLFLSHKTPPAVSEIQHAFSLPAQRRLDISESYEALPAWQFLSTHICRYPIDLRAHSQRILLARQDNLQNRLPGSVLDLFLTLESNGQSLKHHLFELSAPFMSRANETFFQHLINHPEERSYQRYWLPGSVLSTGEQQPFHALISKVPSTTHEYTDVLTEAKACLEYGQVDAARQLLEKEIIEQRHTPALEAELLAIYHHTQDKERLEKFSGILQDQAIPLSAQWVKTKQDMASL